MERVAQARVRGDRSIDRSFAVDSYLTPHTGWNLDSWFRFRWFFFCFCCIREEYHVVPSFGVVENVGEPLVVF